MPYLRHSSPADNPAACSFSTLIICSSVNLLLRMSVSLGNGLYPKTGAFKGSRSDNLPSFRLLRPGFSTAEMWTKTSFKEALERNTVTVKRGETRIESKYGKRGAPTRVAAAQGEVRGPLRCR